MINLAEFVVNAYSNILEQAGDDISSIGTAIPIPGFQTHVIRNICFTAKETFSIEPTILTIKSNIVIVGDIHGSLLDLLRIFKELGPPPITSYLFLGDYVDRGSFSLETIILLFSYMNLYPKNVYLLRGNHEFSSVNSTYGFLNELKETYPNDLDLFDIFNETFNYMPLAALIDDTTFCVHGGLSQTFSKISTIDDQLKRPLAEYISNQMLEDLMWSDPSMTCPQFSPSMRGAGVNYGEVVLSLFLQENKITCLVRGHQCVNNGIEILFHKKLATVFSCSSYNKHMNKSGVLLKSGEMFDVRIFEANLPKIPREKASFFSMPVPRARPKSNSKLSLSVRSFKGTLSPTSGTTARTAAMRSPSPVARVKGQGSGLMRMGSFRYLAVTKSNSRNDLRKLFSPLTASTSVLASALSQSSSTLASTGVAGVADDEERDQRQQQESSNNSVLTPRIDTEEGPESPLVMF